jgi:hypothetical protein
VNVKRLTEFRRSPAGLRLQRRLLGIAVFTIPGQEARAQPAVGQDAPTPHVIARTLMGGTAIELRAGTNLVRIALAGDLATLSLDLRASDARLFADSLSRALAVRRGRRRDWNVRVEEPGTSAGALSLTMRISGRDSTLTLFAADETLAEVRQVLTPREALVFSRQIRAAVAAAVQQSVKTRPAPNARRPPS